MWRTTVKGLLARKVRFLLTSFAVVLGVAFMSGTMVLTDTVQRTFDGLFEESNKGIDAVVRAKSTLEGGEHGFGPGQRPLLGDATLERVRATEGVAAAEGDLSGFAILIGKDGKPVNTGAQGPPAFGFAWSYDPRLNPLDIAGGHEPRDRREVVIDKASADKGKFALGDTIRVVTQSGSAEYVLAGIVTFGEADSPLGASIVSFTPETAQKVLEHPGQWNSIGVAAVEGVSEEEVVANLRAALADPKIEVLTGSQLTRENQSDVKEAIGFFGTFLLVFAIVGLFVGTFVIYNSFSITVAQRTREMALLRAVGALRRQVLGAVLLEALLSGVVASAAGLGLGILLATGLKAGLAAAGMSIPAGGTVVQSDTVVISAVAGVGVTLVASVFPALRASRVPPIAALRDVATGGEGRLLARSLIGAAIVVFGVVNIVRGLFGDVGNALLAVGVGAGVVFLGVAVLGPVFARPVARVLGTRPVGVAVTAMGAVLGLAGVTLVATSAVDGSGLGVAGGLLLVLVAWAFIPSGLAAFGIQGRLGRENAMRNPKRTSATAAALMIGVGLVGFITIFAASARASIEVAVDQQVRADFLVNSKSFGMGGLSPRLAEEIAKIPGVEAASGVRFGSIGVHEPDARRGAKAKTKEVTAIDPRVADRLFNLGYVLGSFSDLGPTDVALFEDVARDLGLQVGDPLDLEFAETGRKTFTVRALYGKKEFAGDYAISLPAYEANFADQFDLVVAVKLVPGASRKGVTTAIDRLLKDYPNGELQDQEEFKDSQADRINQMLNLIYALLALAVLISMFGIATTLALSVYERTRELGLLRAVGMQRSQLRRTVRWESVIVALFGTVLGLGIGLFFGWVLVAALADEGFTELSVPPGQILAVVILGAGVGVLSALWPARRASKLDMLEAIGTE